MGNSASNQASMMLATQKMGSIAGDLKGPEQPAKSANMRKSIEQQRKERDSTSEKPTRPKGKMAELWAQNKQQQA